MQQYRKGLYHILLHSLPCWVQERKELFSRTDEAQKHCPETLHPNQVCLNWSICWSALQTGGSVSGRGLALQFGLASKIQSSDRCTLRPVHLAGTNLWTSQQFISCCVRPLLNVVILFSWAHTDITVLLPFLILRWDITSCVDWGSFWGKTLQAPWRDQAGYCHS